MHDVLRRMLTCPVFLDSSTLSDLRGLITDGVHKSETLVLLATKGVLTRPWCLIELFEAKRAGVPIVICELANSGWVLEEQRDFISNLEDVMEVCNPEGLQLLRAHYDGSLTELKETIIRVLDAERELQSSIVFNAHYGDQETVAALKDVVERCASSTQRSIEWNSDFIVTRSSEKTDKMTRSSEGTDKKIKKPKHLTSNEVLVNSEESKIFICCSREDAIADARVLRSELEMRLGRPCAIGGGPDTHTMIINGCEAFIVLLTKDTLSNSNALHEIWLALIQGHKPTLVAVGGVEHSYDFGMVNELLNPERINPIFKGAFPADADFETVSAMLHSNLKSIIAVSWYPAGSDNHTQAVANNITSRMEFKMMRRNSSRSVLRSLGLVKAQSSMELIEVRSSTSVANLESIATPSSMELFKEESSTSVANLESVATATVSA